MQLSFKLFGNGRDPGACPGGGPGGSAPHTDLAQIIVSLQQLKALVRRIASIQEVVVKSYVGGDEIMDIEKSAPQAPATAGGDRPGGTSRPFRKNG